MLDLLDESRPLCVSDHLPAMSAGYVSRIVAVLTRGSVESTFASDADMAGLCIVVIEQRHTQDPPIWHPRALRRRGPTCFMRTFEAARRCRVLAVDEHLGTTRHDTLTANFSLS